MDKEHSGVSRFLRYRSTGSSHRDRESVPALPALQNNNVVKQSLGQDPIPPSQPHLHIRNKTAHPRPPQPPSNNNTRTTALPPTPSPRHNRQHNNSQHIHLTRNPQQPTLFRLRHHSPLLRFIEIYTPVRTPKELVRSRGEDVVEGAFEDVA